MHAIKKPLVSDSNVKKITEGTPASISNIITTKPAGHNHIGANSAAICILVSSALRAICEKSCVAPPLTKKARYNKMIMPVINENQRIFICRLYFHMRQEIYKCFRKKQGKNKNKVFCRDCCCYAGFNQKMGNKPESMILLFILFFCVSLIGRSSRFATMRAFSGRT